MTRINHFYICICYFPIHQILARPNLTNQNQTGVLYLIRVWWSAWRRKLREVMASSSSSLHFISSLSVLFANLFLLFYKLLFCLFSFIFFNVPFSRAIDFSSYLQLLEDQARCPSGFRLSAKQKVVPLEGNSIFIFIFCLFFFFCILYRKRYWWSGFEAVGFIRWW